MDARRRQAGAGGAPAAGSKRQAGQRMATPKIALVGAGSTVFAKNLLGDILGCPELAGAEIRLHDIDPERLRVSEAVARRVAAGLGAPALIEATIEATLDRARALDGADHVVTMIQVGGYRPCTVTDFAVPKRHGL